VAILVGFVEISYFECFHGITRVVRIDKGYGSTKKRSLKISAIILTICSALRRLDTIQFASIDRLFLVF
jgi:hypothetical protein